MILVTGSAGFSGRYIVAGLNEAGQGPVVVSDLLHAGLKW